MSTGGKARLGPEFQGVSLWHEFTCVRVQRHYASVKDSSLTTIALSKLARLCPPFAEVVHCLSECLNRILAQRLIHLHTFCTYLDFQMFKKAVSWHL